MSVTTYEIGDLIETDGPAAAELEQIASEDRFERDHAISIKDVTISYGTMLAIARVPSCACGWQGRPSSPDEAHRAAERHRREVQ